MSASYTQLSRSELEARVQEIFSRARNCNICPWSCSVDRTKGEKGICHLGVLPKVYSFHPHFGEEKPLVGQNGSGTIFFSSCNLSCVYCQNYKISQLREGKEISFQELAEMMLSLQERGCHNINLVTPTSQVLAIVQAVLLAREGGLEIPLVYNTGTYDSVETLKLLDGIVDIYMPDAKYGDNEMAERYSLVPNYFTVMKRAVEEMFRQVGNLNINSQGIAEKGLLVRHLILPNNLAGSEGVFNFLARLSKDVFVNIMEQYRPCYKANEFPKLSRSIKSAEYQEAIQLAKKAGLDQLYT